MLMSVACTMAAQLQHLKATQPRTYTPQTGEIAGNFRRHFTCRRLDLQQQGQQA